MKIQLLIPVILLLVSLSSVWAQPPHADPLAENLFPPELIMQNGEAIGLTEEQRDFIMTEIHKTQQHFAEMHQKLQTEVEATAALLKKDRVDEAAALAQFDKVLNQEREIKRAHLALVLAIKSKLTAEQRAKLQEIKNQQPHRVRAKLPLAIPQKMERVKAAVQKWQDEGRDPSQVGELMQGFEPLMKEQKFKEAEELLDKALKILDGEKKKSEADGQKSAGLSTKHPVGAPASVGRVRPELRRTELRTPLIVPANGKTLEALQAEIQSLRPDKQVWREIVWQRCLLEGLHEARTKNKPVILWAFINSNPCDERC